jgi:hypothetical protein
MGVRAIVFLRAAAVKKFGLLFQRMTELGEISPKVFEAMQFCVSQYAGRHGGIPRKPLARLLRKAAKG